MKKIGIIGYGTIGTYLVQKIKGDKELELAFVYDIDKNKTSSLEELCLDNFEDFSTREANLIVECAMPQAVFDYAPLVLTNTDMLIFSITSLADDSFREKLEDICRENKTKLYVPHGAILGLDGIYDGRNVLKKVKITTIKNPKSLNRDDIKLTQVYSGSTKEACKLYPRNVNVHAALALAGIGFNNTISEIISDPNTDVNSHMIEAEGNGTEFKIEVKSKRKGLVTGTYTLESAYNTIKRICSKNYGINII